MQPNQPTPPSPGSEIPPQPSAQPLQTTPAPDYLHPISDKPQHTYNPKRMIIILSVVVAASLLAVAAMLVVALMPPQQPHKPTTQTTTKTTPVESTLTAKQTIEHIKVYFKGTATAKSPITTPVIAPGKSFYTVIPDIAPLASVAGEVIPDTSDAQLASIVKSLDYDKFTKRVFSDGTKQTNYLADFTRDDVVCQTAVTKSSDVKASHWFEVRCLDMSQYAEYAGAQQPLVSLYTPTTSTATKYGFIGKPAVTASKSAGYNFTEITSSTVIDQRMSAVNSKSMFYQTPDGLWHYFRDHTDGIYVECEQYNTPVLKYAYYGQPCRSLAKDTVITVALPQKN